MLQHKRQKCDFTNLGRGSRQGERGLSESMKFEGIRERISSYILNGCLYFYRCGLDKGQHRCKAVKENQIGILFSFLTSGHRQRCSVGAEYETRSTAGIRREQILLFSSLSVSPNMHVLQYRIRMITSRREIPTFCIQLYAVVAPDLC